MVQQVAHKLLRTRAMLINEVDKETWAPGAKGTHTVKTHGGGEGC